MKLEMLHHFIGDRNMEPVANLHHFRFREFLRLVSRIAALSRLAQSVAFHRLRQNDGWFAGRFHRPLIGVINLHRIVPAAPQRPDVVVARGAPPASTAPDTSRKIPCGCKRHFAPGKPGIRRPRTHACASSAAAVESRASRSSHPDPHRHLMTFQPAPRNAASSS